MFVAGECASILLHRDLEMSAGAPAQGSFGAAEEKDRFAGWPVLKDIEGLEGDEEANRRITGRFLVARLLRGLLDDDLVADPASLEHQLKGIRREISGRDGACPEGEVWERALTAVEARDFRGLLSATLEWGSLVESMGHLSGAREIHSMAYELAVAEGELGSAVDAARFRGRVSRKLARWEDAVHWYGVARSVAEEAGEKRKLAMVMDGLGNAYRDRGNLPRAREILGQVLALGRGEGDRHAEAVAHHDLMTVEKLSGNLEEAVAHGWAASQRYEDREGRLKALFDLAGVLKDSGELSAAWDAYSVVEAQVSSHEYRLMALDGLAHVAALRGQEGRYEAFRSRVDEMAWREASAVIQAQILLYRGLSLQALGRLAEAKDWLDRALAYAEKHGFSQRIFEAERALGDLENLPRRGGLGRTSPGIEAGEEVLQVRAGLREMREALAGAGGPL
jgi:tetratricopeptide (TPR) repeat protein